MKQALGRCWVGCVSITLFAAVASAQQHPTFSLKAVKKNGVAITPSNSINALPGELIEAEMLISEWSPSGQRLNSFQWDLDIASLESGPRGQFAIPDVPRSCVTTPPSFCDDLGDACNPATLRCTRECTGDLDCQGLGEDCVSGFCALTQPLSGSVILNNDDPDFVYFGRTALVAVDPTPAGPRWGGAVFSPADAPLYGSVGTPPIFNSPRYAGTLMIRSSGDACGVFTIRPIEANLSLVATDQLPIAPITSQSLSINLGTCQCRSIIVDLVADPPVDSDPPNCSVDARQPSEPPVGSELQGPASIVVEMDCDVVTNNLQNTHFCTTQVPQGQPALSVSSVVRGVGGNNNRIQLNFNRIITPRRWACVQYAGNPPNCGDPIGEQACITHLPGDVNTDRIVAPLDVNSLLTCLNPVTPCPLSRCDVDRTGVCGPRDIIRLVDLENGGDQYIVWRDLTVIACPSP